METTDLIWRKASKSENGGASCVEVGTTANGHAAGIRDSKSPERGHLVVTPTVLGALLASVRAGELEMRLGTSKPPEPCQTRFRGFLCSPR
jgi:hypothetical protein